LTANLSPGTVTIDGTPIAAGTASFTVNATDSAGATVSQLYHVTINANTAVMVNVSGSQGYASATPAFTHTTTPAAATVTGRLSCTTVNGGTVINSSLAAGSYTIDGASCKGLRPAAGYSLSYEGVNNGYVVKAAPTRLVLIPVPSGPIREGSPVGYDVLVSKGTTRGTLTGTVSFTSNGAPIARCSNLHLVLGLGFCATSFPSGGSYAIVATYAGDLDFASSFASLTQVVDQAPVITSINHTSATPGKALSFQVTASGYPAPRFTEEGALPKGVCFSSQGLLSGTPQHAGIYTITITAANVAGIVKQTFTLTT
jgi:hypothetical protein